MQTPHFDMDFRLCDSPDIMALPGVPLAVTSGAQLPSGSSLRACVAAVRQPPARRRLGAAAAPACVHLKHRQQAPASTSRTLKPASLIPSTRPPPPPPARSHQHHRRQDAGLSQRVLAAPDAQLRAAAAPHGHAARQGARVLAGVPRVLGAGRSGPGSWGVGRRAWVRTMPACRRA